MTSGDALQLEVDAATFAAGNIINCTVDTVSVFTVAEDGALVIAGTATGTDALTLTLGLPVVWQRPRRRLQDYEQYPQIDRELRMVRQTNETHEHARNRPYARSRTHRHTLSSDTGRACCRSTRSTILMG